MFSPGSSVVLLQAEDIDDGDNGYVEYSITDIVDGANNARPGYFIFQPDSGLLITNTGPENLDRETEDTYRLTILLKDRGTHPLQTTGLLIITLIDINDQPPFFETKIYT